MKRVAFHPAARTELMHAVSYYENQKPGLGRELKNEVEQVVSRVQQTPLSFPASDVKEVRMAMLQRFPFMVYFQERPDHIRLVAIAHHKRRPMYWARRVK